MIATSCLLLPPPPPTPSLPCTGSFIFSFTPPPDGLVMSTSTSHTARRELSTVLNQLTLPERFRYESGPHPSTTSISESARGQIGGKVLFRNDQQTRSRSIRSWRTTRCSSTRGVDFRAMSELGTGKVVGWISGTLTDSTSIGRSFWSR